jgi:hypothetical protein
MLELEPIVEGAKQKRTTKYSFLGFQRRVC